MAVVKVCVSLVQQRMGARNLNTQHLVNSRNLVPFKLPPPAPLGGGGGGEGVEILYFYTKVTHTWMQGYIYILCLYSTWILLQIPLILCISWIFFNTMHILDTFYTMHILDIHQYTAYLGYPLILCISWISFYTLHILDTFNTLHILDILLYYAYLGYL